ncbi:hypothetical protein BDZ88DRAFT_454938 [Geranomyces variabilis]|nr:hypothetical protein BDZ88DRAFT_454938 [Geranomyces variabilis]KAJ3138530.1 hypothetical protein HDU90_000971 [Geranomyces variabilis]
MSSLSLRLLALLAAVVAQVPDNLPVPALPPRPDLPIPAAPTFPPLAGLPIPTVLTFPLLTSLITPALPSPTAVAASSPLSAPISALSSVVATPSAQDSVPSPSRPSLASSFTCDDANQVLTAFLEPCILDAQGASSQVTSQPQANQVILQATQCICAGLVVNKAAMEKLGTCPRHGVMPSIGRVEQNLNSCLNKDYGTVAPELFKGIHLTGGNGELYTYEASISHAHRIMPSGLTLAVAGLAALAFLA